MEKEVSDIPEFVPAEMPAKSCLSSDENEASNDAINVQNDLGIVEDMLDHTKEPVFWKTLEEILGCYGNTSSKPEEFISSLREIHDKTVSLMNLDWMEQLCNDGFKLIDSERVASK